jgi:hypothetical protein
MNEKGPKRLVAFRRYLECHENVVMAAIAKEVGLDQITVSIWRKEDEWPRETR